MRLTFLDEAFSVPGGIGLFDSGVGGLTVLEPLAGHDPRWPTVMVADQAHVPYGGRALEEVRGFALAQASFLFQLGVEQVVMACNISSATALDEARRRHGGDRVWGMVEPGCALAVKATLTGRIGVLATEGTVRSGAYERRLKAIDPGIACAPIACPDFVPLIEASHVDDDLARRAVAPYIQRLRAHRVDVAILGCTHYPHLLGVLRDSAPEIAFVDPADGILERVRSRVSAAPGPVLPRILTTSDPRHLGEQIETLHPRIARPELGRVIWRGVRSDVDDDPTRAVP